MKKIITVFILFFFVALTHAQIKTAAGNVNLDDIKKILIPEDVSSKIFAKAKEHKLGSIDSESSVIRRTAAKGG